jgi:16S rRNA (uracil1498-N3)-methyltransferase
MARRAAAAQVLVDDPARPVVTGAQAHHLERVLRLQAGETVVATDGRGRWALCRYGGGRRLEPQGAPADEAAPAPAVTVAFAPVKGERTEWVAQKLTELGVDRIVVIASARSVVRWSGDRERAAMERLRRVVAEAACQSRRVWLPEVSGVVPLDALSGRGLALAEPGAPPLGTGCTGVVVGPEGGWDRAELEMGWPTVALGPNVLRAETAAVAAGVLLGAQRAGTV